MHGPWLVVISSCSADSAPKDGSEPSMFDVGVSLSETTRPTGRLQAAHVGCLTASCLLTICPARSEPARNPSRSGMRDFRNPAQRQEKLFGGDAGTAWHL